MIKDLLYIGAGGPHLLLHALCPDSGAHPAHVLRERPGQCKEDGAADVILLTCVYNGATAEYHDICNYWGVEDSGIVTANINEQKTDAIHGIGGEIVVCE